MAKAPEGRLSGGKKEIPASIFFFHFSLTGHYGRRVPSQFGRFVVKQKPVREAVSVERVNRGSDEANGGKCKEMRRRRGMTKGFRTSAEIKRM